MPLGLEFRHLEISELVRQLETMIEQAKLLVKGINQQAASGLLTNDIILAAGVLQRMLDRVER
jgi:hypothetical protein